jgi:hypothetical protein
VAVSSIEIVTCSTGALVLPVVIGTLPISSAGRYGMPHWPGLDRRPRISVHCFSVGSVLMV